MESLDFATGSAGVVMVVGTDLSDTGGDGGVSDSDTSEDVDLVGGVTIVGDELDVAGDISDKAD